MINLLKNFSGIHWKYIKYLGIILVLLGSASLGYKLSSSNCQEEKLKALQNLVKEQTKIEKENREINDSVYEDLAKNKQKTRIIQNEVIRYVEKNPDLNNCSLDASGLRLWNGEAE